MKRLEFLQPTCFRSLFPAYTVTQPAMLPRTPEKNLGNSTQNKAEEKLNKLLTEFHAITPIRIW